MLRAKIIFCPYEAGYFYGVYNENSDFIRTPELFLRLKKREFCFKPYQRVVHAGAAMRSSIPLPLHLAVGLRPMGIFAKIVLREQACTQLNQRVVHAGAAMRSSIPLPLHLAVGLRPMGIFTKKLLRKQACTQLFGKYSRMAQLSHIFLKIPLHFPERPGIILLAVT